MQPDLILHNGRIYTVDRQQPWVEAIAIAEGHILAMGDSETILSLSSPTTAIRDLGGKLALPGLVDSHIHLYDWCRARRSVPLAGCGSKEEMLARIKAWAKQLPPGTWITGQGWNEREWPKPELPTRYDLDQVTGDHPALFQRVDMHAAVVNSSALRMVGISEETPDPEGGLIGRGSVGDHDSTSSRKPNGLLWELAINLVGNLIPRPGIEEFEGMLLDGIKELNRLGITAAHDQRMKGQQEGPLALAVYQRLAADGKLNLRINCNIAAHDLPHIVALGLRTGFGNDVLRIGHMKLFADGSMGSQTAWVLAPYAVSSGDKDGQGVCVTPPEQMATEIRLAADNGISSSVHAIGDRANRVVLDIFEEIASGGNRLPIPHRLEHVQIIDPDDIPRLARNDITASVQPIHALDDMDLADQVLGSRADRTYNFGRLAASGARLALGSDAPVAGPNPFLGFHGAICRQRPARMDRQAWFGNERLTLEQTVYGYTMGAAIAAGWQATIGSISPGKRADVIVLDRDIFDICSRAITNSDLAETKVLLTVFDGKIVHDNRDQ